LGIWNEYLAECLRLIEPGNLRIANNYMYKWWKDWKGDGTMQKEINDALNAFGWYTMFGNVNGFMDE
jgi:hypothetical protein